MMTAMMACGAFAGCAAGVPDEGEQDAVADQESDAEEQVGETAEALSAKCRNTCGTMEDHCVLGCNHVPDCASTCNECFYECEAWCDAPYPGW